jgi:NAD(P)-dependent dehydrogenase (short-subunit alcohol dehydrogenase family)
MQEKVALVTGATAGIGFFTALGLANRGAHVIITGRDAERGERAQAELRRRAGHDRITFTRVDHARLNENRALGAHVAQRFGRLDVLVNNAGGIFLPDDQPSALAPSAQGYEPNLTLNFLAPFALTDALLTLMLASGGGRIVNVVANGRYPNDPFAPEPSLELAPGGIVAAVESYARAKLLNLVWTMGLARELARTPVVVNAVEPAVAWTPGVERLAVAAASRSRYLWPLLRWFLRRRSPERAARAAILASSEPSYASLSGWLFGSNGKPHSPPVRALDHDYQEHARSLGLRLVACAARPEN